MQSEHWLGGRQLQVSEYTSQKGSIRLSSFWYARIFSCLAKSGTLINVCQILGWINWFYNCVKIAKYSWTKEAEEMFAMGNCWELLWFKSSMWKSNLRLLGENWASLIKLKELNICTHKHYLENTIAYFYCFLFLFLHTQHLLIF